MISLTKGNSRLVQDRIKRGLATALKASVPSLKKKLLEKIRPRQGLEPIFQESVEKAFSGALQREILAREIGIGRRNVDLKSVAGTRGKVDLVSKDKKIALEIKIVRLPRLTSLQNNGALWDLGQIANDYHDLANAKLLSHGFIVLLIDGDLIEILKTAHLIKRELHNRLFVDYETSRNFGQIRDDCGKKGLRGTMRRNQVKAIKAMGFDRPYHERPRGRKHQVILDKNSGQFAVAIIPVSRM